MVMKKLTIALLLLVPFASSAYSLDMASYVGERAREAGLNPALVVAIGICESQLVPSAYNHKGEHSRGIFQINGDAWPNVSPIQAFNFEFNVAWAIRHMQAGRFSMWSRCWKPYRNVSMFLSPLDYPHIARGTRLVVK